MSRYWNDDYERYRQLTSGELKQKVRATEKKAGQKGNTLHPVVIEGRIIAKSWWGQAWCSNLERYADFESRLDRGKRYVRSGAVVDLDIESGRILARVQGSRRTPYKTEIRISPLSEEQCDQLLDQCTERIDSMEQLISGNFPDSLKNIFFGRGGLFPEPREISFSCSCPDWALMCKHVAAALYGVGARLDEDPLLFFKLRGIDVNRFIGVALDNKVEKMLSHADCRSSRIIEEKNVSSLFGVI